MMTTTLLHKRQRGEALGALLGLAFGVACFAAWLTHLYVCFNNARWGFLIAGAIFFPIAIVHGVGIWFGVWPSS
jgi:hypothetical protein